MPLCFCEMDTGWAFVVFSSFNYVHVSTSWKMVVGKFDDEDFGAILQSIKGFAWNIQVSGFEGMLGPVQLFLSMSFLQSRGLLAACRSCWANRRVIVSPLIVRLALEAGIKGTIVEG